MIIDTTYLLPLVRIGIDKDLLKAVLEKKVSLDINLAQLKVNLISIFELQAKASKLNIPPEDVYKAMSVVFDVFEIIPFYNKEIIRVSYELNRRLGDYIDSIILSTAVVLKEDLITEDSLILSLRKEIYNRYGINVLCYEEVIET